MRTRSFDEIFVVIVSVVSWIFCQILSRWKWLDEHQWLSDIIVRQVIHTTIDIQNWFRFILSADFESFPFPFSCIPNHVITECPLITSSFTPEAVDDRENFEICHWMLISFAHFEVIDRFRFLSQRVHV